VSRFPCGFRLYPQGVLRHRAALSKKNVELKVIINPIDQAGPARRLLSNLFYGWGYNFYRRENELHTDDLLIRGKLSQLLRDSRMHVALLHGAFLRKHLPRGRGLSRHRKWARWAGTTVRSAARSPRSWPWTARHCTRC